MLVSARKRNILWVILALTLVGLALRLYCLDCHGLWFDELASVEVAQRGLGAIFTDRFGWMRTQTPLHYLIIWLMIQPVDPTQSAVLVRLPSALAGALSVPALYLLGRELFGRAQGLLAALLLALTEVHLNYSQDVRPYTMIVLFTTLTTFCLVRAERTGQVRWWLLFTVVAVFNLWNAYVALTLATPALLPYMAWALWAALRKRHSKSSNTIAVLGSTLLVGVACVLVLLDTIQVPRAAPDWRQLSVESLWTVPVELASWFTQFAVEGSTERLIQLNLVLLALLGLYSAGRSAKRRGGAICLLFVTVPALALALLATSNVVYQRYALFVMPFYLLLVANGLVGMVASYWKTSASVLRLVRAVGWGLLGLTIGLFSFSAYNYVVHGGREGIILTDRSDFRSVSSYLAREAGTEDLIVFAGWDPTVSNFYWKGEPPARVYSILDPRLFGQRVEGNIYWVVSYSEFNLPEPAVSDSRWVVKQPFQRILVLAEAGEGDELKSRVEKFVDGLELISPRTRAVQHTISNLRGSLYQHDDLIEDAARAYREAGTFFPIGEEYLRTSYGFAERGDLARAWRDALISKSVQPYSPELHKWMAEMLAWMGLAEESRIEQELAQELKRAY